MTACVYAHIQIHTHAQTPVRDTAHMRTCTHVKSAHAHAGSGQVWRAGQTDAYKTISAYFRPLGWVRLGPLFTTLVITLDTEPTASLSLMISALQCCFVWCVYVALEVRNAANITRAVVDLKGPRTTINAVSGRLEITAVSPIRVGFFLAVQLVRVAIAVALFIGASTHI